MKETPFAVVLISFVAFIGVLYGLVLIEENQTSSTNDESIFNQFKSGGDQTRDNLTPENNTMNQSKHNQTNQTNFTENTTIQTTNFTVKTILGIKTSMRDGVKLVSDVWLPQQNGTYPVIIIRTPYGRNTAEMNYTAMGDYFASHGYVFMVQDVRGKGDSEGDFEFLFQEGQDGYDTIEWAANQSWSNGKVGMMGSDYMGADQWLAAAQKPPHLVCIAPTSAYGRYMEEIPSVGGVFYMGWALPWTLENNGRTQDINTQNINWTVVFNHRPLINADNLTGTKVPIYRQFLEHPTMDSYWKRIQFTEQDFDNITIPSMTTSGWFDTDQPGALYYWNGIGKNSSKVGDHYLIIGPWNQTGTFDSAAQSSEIGDLPVPGAQVNTYETHLAFFNRYLKNSTQTNSTNKSDLPQVTVYITGLSEWINLTTYPPQDTNSTPLYLESGGQADTSTGNGFLTWNFPKNSSSNSSNNSGMGLNATYDNYTYDPSNPRVVEMGSFATGSMGTENRSDVLVYTTSTLEEPVMILGSVFVELYASSDAKDTDFVVRLLDVYPNGTAINLGPEEFGGAIRARFRQGFDEEVLLEPGKIEKYRIELFDMGHVFLSGHKIRLEVSSSAYPLLHPNPNTGNPIATDTKQVTAHQTIYHDQKHPSAVYLPIISSNSTLYHEILG